MLWMHCSLKAYCARPMLFYPFPLSLPDVCMSYTTREIQAAKGGSFVGEKLTSNFA